MFNKNADSKKMREALANQIRGLPPPRSYFSGACAHEAVLPDNIIVFSRRGGLNASSPTFHNRYVLVCGVEGQGDIVLDGTAFRFVPGAAFLIHPFQFHHYANIPGDTMVWLFITFDFSRPDIIAPLRNTPAILSPRGWQEAALILEGYMSTINGTPCSGRMLALRLRLLLDEMMGARHLRSQRMRPPEDRFLGDVCAYIYAHLDGDLGVASIARALSISESHLRNRFRQVSGGSIGTYVRHARLHRACALMHTSHATISSIALTCGFDSLYSFSRAFKQTFHVSPSEWRERTNAEWDSVTE